MPRPKNISMNVNGIGATEEMARAKNCKKFRRKL
jgi:hypothetical protein